jgi:isopenicillin N synthase-like dioxygenase
LRKRKPALPGGLLQPALCSRPYATDIELSENKNMHLPVVDYSAPHAAAEFCKSLHSTGFAVLKNHPLHQDLVQGIYAEWLDFFHSPAKWQYPHDPERHDGYFAPSVSETAKNHSQKDLKEFYHLYPWGRYPQEVSDAAQRYYAQGAALAATLLNWVETHSPAEVKARYSMPLPDMIAGSEHTLLRVLHYPPLQGNEAPGAMRAAAHGDINLLTILPAATEPGLQVLGQDQLWHDVPCDFGLLIVNIGDMLAEASGHYYPSTVHRVLNPQGAAAQKSRISLPLFLHPRREVVLSERYTVGSYFDERMQELRGNKAAA